MTDNINQPAHYTAGGIETIDVIEGVLGKYDHRDQVEKYNQRAHLKGNFKEDLEKARWYLNRTIDNCDKGLLEVGTGTPVPPTIEKSECPIGLNTNSVYEDSDGDFWAFNHSEEEWHYYLIDNDEVIGKSTGGFAQSQMSAYSRGFFTPVANTLSILLAILRYESGTEEDEPRFDTATVHKDESGDYWVYNESTQEWAWYTLSEDLSTVESRGATYTVEELELHYNTNFIKPVALMRTERMVREAVEKFENPEPVTDPKDRVKQHLPVKDRQGDVWVWSEEDEAWYWYFVGNVAVTSRSREWSDEVVQNLAVNFFEERPTDKELDAIAKYNESIALGVFQDLHTKVIYWAKEDSDWRYYVITDGVCRYASSRTFQAPTTQSVKLPNDQARQIRSIIARGVFA